MYCMATNVLLCPLLCSQYSLMLPAGPLFISQAYITQGLAIKMNVAKNWLTNRYLVE